MSNKTPILKSRNKEHNARHKVLAQRRRLVKKSNDQRTLQYIKQFLTVMLIDVFETLDGLYSKADYTKDCETLNQRLTHEGICFATKTLPAYINTVLELIDCKEASFTGWKVNPINRIPLFLGGVTNLVLESTDPIISTLAFESLYTFCVAFKKLRGGYDNKKLTQQYESFVEVDTSLMDEVIPTDIALTARELASSFIKDIDLSDKSFLPRPGPGATNTPSRKCMRYSPRTLFRQVDDVMPYVDWFLTHYIRVVEHSKHYIQLEKTAIHRQTARFKFVPKTYEKARGICLEENEVQVLQQAIRAGLWDYIKNHPTVGPCLPLDNQGVNALLALESSLSGLFATLDMSDASNRIVRVLVAWMFQANEEFVDVLLALSTRVIIPPKLDGLKATPYECKMYAPMGSGLCFPIMSLVHLFLVQAIMLNADPKCTSADINSVRVYGDDIVLPSQYAQSVLTHLPKFGMKLNKTKSFYNGKFRESCGTHALNGMNVTPVYVKNVPVVDDLTVLQSLLKNEADYYNKKFLRTAEFLRKTLFVTYPKLDLGRYQAREECGFAGIYRRGSDVPRGKTRWNEDYQCMFIRVPRFSTRVIPAEITEEESYLRWLWTHSENSRVVDDGTLATTIAWCWVPESHTYTSSVFSEKLLKHAPMYCVDGLIW